MITKNYKSKNRDKTSARKINSVTEIIDFEILKKFNIYFQFLCSYTNISTFDEMKKGAKNELEKSID